MTCSQGQSISLMALNCQLWMSWDFTFTLASVEYLVRAQLLMIYVIMWLIIHVGAQTLLEFHRYELVIHFWKINCWKFLGIIRRGGIYVHVCAEAGAGVLQLWETTEEADIDTDLVGKYKTRADCHSGSHTVYTCRMQTRRNQWTNEVDCTYCNRLIYLSYVNVALCVHMS